jgi:predicted lipoprotein with Yx(FWY)xxD motif
VAKNIRKEHDMKVLAFSIGAVVAALSLTYGLSIASASSSSAGSPAKVASASSKLGQILVDKRGRTLYLFEKDKNGKSACYGSCARFWPPILTRGKPFAGAGVKAKLLGVTKRKNGTHQVTYAGHPLYRYVADTKAGQTTGEGSTLFGAGWDAVAPSGKKIESD